MTFQCFHHHLVFMLEKVLPKSKRLLFNVLKKRDVVLDFLKDCGIHCDTSTYDLSSFSEMECEFNENEQQGSYFNEKVETVEHEDAEDLLETSNLFGE
ncbi:hypothetical protein C0J52_05870 [Blattella germanica]|nr:hypothetical protein C0J52_05870 [Blattella germanica]